MNRRGEELMSGIKKINSRLVKEVRGKGLMIALDLRIRFKDVLFKQLENGLISLYSGLTTLRYLPPYIITEAEVNEALSIIEKSIMEIENSRFV